MGQAIILSIGQIFAAYRKLQGSLLWLYEGFPIAPGCLQCFPPAEIASSLPCYVARAWHIAHPVPKLLHNVKSGIEGLTAA